ncbi:MAG: DUF192 domain-containing protein [Candidatus Woesearchaeota archaeon]
MKNILKKELKKFFIYFHNFIKELTKDINPHTITISRFLLGFLMILSAIFQKNEFFLFFYALALISDLLDGFIARAHNRETKIGKLLDIIADNFILICLFIGFFFFKKRFIFMYQTHLLFILGYYFFVQILSLIFTTKLIFKRTIAANISAIIFPFLIFFLFLFNLSFFVYPYLLLMIYSLSEKLILSLAKEDKLSLFHLKEKSHLIFLFFLVIVVSILFYFITFPFSESKIACFENKCIKAEIRDEEKERELGLMFRENLSENEGMLFIFQNNVNYAFWMKNMKFNIDIIFIDKNKKIVSITKNAFPCNKPDKECELYYSNQAYKYVIEVVANFTEKYNIKEGQKVYFE